jgi:nucleoside-diphosphate-sugar epimerase
MKIIVTGPLGNISQPLATALVQQKYAITLISSKPPSKPSGRTRPSGSLEDADFLAPILTGADAMVAPNVATPDLRAYF